MKIISITPSENGAYQGIHVCEGALPIGHAIVPDALDMTSFYDYNGFVTLEIEIGRDAPDIVTGYTPNVEALEAWKASLPPEPAPTIDEMTQLRLAIAELAEAQTADQTANELALAELADFILGGEN